MPDTLTPTERSARMAMVRGKGNRSTEGRVEELLRAQRIRGWKKHPNDILGKPDFYFPSKRLAVFIDGCFWHACPKCARRTPSTRQEFWRAKISDTRRRDDRIRRRLRTLGHHVMRIWEHDLRDERWFKRLTGLLRRLD